MAYERRNEGGGDRPRKPFTPRKRYGRRKVCRFCALILTEKRYFFGMRYLST